MKRRTVVCILLTFLIYLDSLGQTKTYSVNKTSFSSDNYDEFSPVYYKNMLVFCTDRNPNMASGYYNAQNKGLIKIYYVDSTGKEKRQIPHLFSKNLKTRYNDGPVTFNERGDTIYFSRNIIVDGKLGELSPERNKLGIFYAVFNGKEWTKTRELRINNEWYNLTTPSLSPDGKKLYFASDKSGGFGGTDLYYSQWKGDYWEDPVNLGPIINTKGNESYPFISQSGELFFSSDGHPGFGGKDIYFTRFSDSVWLSPIRLDAPVNSRYDDFGITTDPLMKEGYFSSNRNKSIDIFHFRTNFPQIFYISAQKENQYCFKFSDNGSINIDSNYLQYKWYFGDGQTSSGAVANHCFSGPGNYSVKLDINEKGSGKLYFTKLLLNIELKDFEQPYITSPDFVLKGEKVEFDGFKTYLPGNEILNYSWDFGDSIRSIGEKVSHSFKEKGEYLVSLGLILKNNSTGNIYRTGVSKKLSVFDDKQEIASFLSGKTFVKTIISDIMTCQNAVIKLQYSAENEFKQEAVFVVEVVSTKNKIGVDSPIFRNLPKKYSIKEKFNPDEGIYSYIVDQQMSLMATYPAYREIYKLGFKDVRIKMIVLLDPAERELHNLIKINGAFAETYFDSSDRLTSNAYIMLDQIVKLMNKYPSLKLEIAVHSDNTGSVEINQTLSQIRSQSLVNYLINRGVDSKRLVATGFGGSKPIAPNFFEKERKLNRRVDFILIN